MTLEGLEACHTTRQGWALARPAAIANINYGVGMSPTIYREGPFRFFFYSNEGGEPPHVHIQSGGGEAKAWIGPPSFASHAGIPARDLARILAIVDAHQSAFLEAWNEHFRQGR